MGRYDMLRERIDLHQGERLVLPMLVDAVRYGELTARLRSDFSCKQTVPSLAHGALEGEVEDETIAMFVPCRR